MNKLIILTAGILALLATGCRKQFGDIERVKLNVKTLYPSYFTKQAADKVEVTLYNTIKGITLTSTSNSEGEVSFEGLLPGIYNINAFRRLTAAEALVLSGFNTDISLSAANNTFEVFTSAKNDTLRLTWGKTGDLLFKEIYYAGSRTPANGSYFSDQFYEIFNNTSDTLYADSLYIGNVGGNPGITSTASPYGFNKDPNYIYLQNVYMIPSDGTGKKYPIAPGKSIIIAQDGINHQSDPLGNANSPVNLGPGIADFESYVPRADNRDLDAPNVPNLVPVYLGSVGFDWLTSVFGASMAIFKNADASKLSLLREPGSTSTATYMQVPITDVIDAVDLLANASYSHLKRIPISMDAGFKNCTGTYTGESIRRKIASETPTRKYLQDTNNSTQDFDLIKPPTPKNWQ